MQLYNMLKFPMKWTNAEGPEAATLLSTRVRLARNLAGFAFPQRASRNDLQKVMEMSLDAAKKIKLLSKAAYVKLEDTERIDRQFLIERHQISYQLASKTKSRAVVVGASEESSVMINEEDHIRIQKISSGFCVHETLDGASALDDELGRQLEFAYDGRFGFLTACPTNVGTGFRVSCLVHLPALTRLGKISRILENLSRFGMIARGLYGEGTSVLGDFYQISNATCLGRTEREFAENLNRLVKSLIARETQMRRELVEGNRKAQTADAVYRALGIMERARTVSYAEAMQNLSLIRMGLSTGLEMPVTLKTLNELMILTQPAHIQMSMKKELRPEERDIERANLIRSKFSS